MRLLTDGQLLLVTLAFALILMEAFDLIQRYREDRIYSEPDRELRDRIGGVLWWRRMVKR